MKPSSQAEQILGQIDHDNVKLGDLRTIAKAIKKDHTLALELWASGQFFPRQLSILLMDPKLLTQEVINKLIDDIEKHPEDQKLQLIDWLLANQFSKDKKTIVLMQNWRENKSSLLRRTFWYHQGRLRWVGQTPPGNTEELLQGIEQGIETEAPEV
ncbi:DNA alkylation repair protein [Flavobacterium caeni]|uniref:DNA alkylation repair enzyme n=1 Tax=Flavobacterium caeni TaxID=490189 RepID=A0A1G5IRR9_9FLAO|nr:DNA alkylation repair protein [Flavobacterium caeni]SCY78667.1 DNA alkylation repair enzyme [Flavobacterium caeni]